jgi:hypothetical protein
VPPLTLASNGDRLVRLYGRSVTIFMSNDTFKSVCQVTNKFMYGVYDHIYVRYENGVGQSNIGYCTGKDAQIEKTRNKNLKFS